MISHSNSCFNLPKWFELLISSFRINAVITSLKNEWFFRHMAAAEAKDAVYNNIQTTFKELFAALIMTMLIERQRYKV